MLRILSIGFFIILLANLSLSAQTKHPKAHRHSKQDTTKPKKRGKKSNPEFDKFLQDQIEFNLPVITCEELKTLTENVYKLVLLDTRTKEAYNFSHIETARRVGFEDFTTENIWMVDREAIVVIYGDSGNKSEKIGEKLREMGYEDIRNLYGSIGEWVHQGYKVVDKDGKETNKVLSSTKSK